MAKVEPRYVVCLRTEGEEDLEIRKLYVVLPDESAAEVGLLRVIDESGEDYLYPVDFFAPVEMSEATARELSAR
jgi:hypothetical protein